MSLLLGRMGKEEGLTSQKVGHACRGKNDVVVEIF